MLAQVNMSSHSQVQTRHKCLHTYAHTHSHKCMHTSISYEPHSPSELRVQLAAATTTVPAAQPPSGHSQQGSVDTVLDTHHQPWMCHLVAQVVVRVSRQAEIAIHQRHQGQGGGRGRQGQLLEATGMSGGRHWLGVPRSPALSPAPSRAPPGTCPDSGC